MIMFTGEELIEHLGLFLSLCFRSSICRRDYSETGGFRFTGSVGVFYKKQQVSGQTYPMGQIQWHVSDSHLSTNAALP